jgi:hypothetical protein
MATTASRINNTGTYFINGNFDEFTGAPVANDNLVFWLDAGQSISYPGTGNNWTSIVSVPATSTLINGPIFSETNGGIISFDGVNDYVSFDIQDSATTVSVITVEMWVKIKATGSRMPFGFTSYDVYLTGGNMGYNTGSSDSYGIPAATVTSLGIVGNWKHLVFVMQNNTSASVNPYTNNKIYVNGVVQSLSQILGTQSGSTRNFNNGVGLISGWNNDITQYKALMDLAVFKIYNRELTVKEIQQNYNALNARFSLTPIAGVSSQTRTKIDTVLASEFDEVSINNGAVAKRETNTGNILVSGRFDEVTGMIVTNGLVAYYDAGKTASQPATGAIWRDISDRGINATPSASPPTFNSAGYFILSAVNEQRYLTTALNPTTWAEPWTIEVWMYTPTGATWSNGVNRSHFISNGSTAGTWGVVRYPTDNQVTTWIRGAAESAETARATLARDRWHQFVGTWNGVNTVSSYLNGAFVGSTTITPTGTPDTGVLPIGGAGSTVSGSPGTFYEGNIAAVMLYNRALSLAEVTNNFEALRDRFGI